MMRIVWGGIALAFILALALGGVVQAADRDEIADLQARLASLEAKMMAPAATGEADSLTSLSKKGQVKIGGDVNVFLRSTHREERNYGEMVPQGNYTNGSAISTKIPLDNVGDNDSYTYTSWDWESCLKIRIDANADTYAYMKFDLEDADDSDDLMEEVYIQFNKIRGSNWGITLGKAEMPFGQDYDKGITAPYVHGQNSTILGNAGDGAGDGATAQTANNMLVETAASFTQVAANAIGQANPHAAVTVAGTGWMGEIDNAIGVQAQYKYKELAKLELAVFQNPAVTDDDAQVQMHEDRSEDQFQSYAVRLTLTPIEALIAEISFANLHQEQLGDSQDGSKQVNGRTNPITQVNLANQYREADQNALSIGMQYKAAKLNTTFFGEYIHNWNMGHLAQTNADIWQLGFDWKATKKLSILSWYEIADIDNGYTRNIYKQGWRDTGRTAAQEVAGIDAGIQAVNYANYTNAELSRLYDSEIDERYQRVVLCGKYKMDSGVEFAVEYLYEWYDNSLGWFADADAHQIAFRTSYAF